MNQRRGRPGAAARRRRSAWADALSLLLIVAVGALAVLASWQAVQDYRREQAFIASDRQGLPIPAEVEVQARGTDAQLAVDTAVGVVALGLWVWLVGRCASALGTAGDDRPTPVRQRERPFTTGAAHRRRRSRRNSAGVAAERLRVVVAGDRGSGRELAHSGV